MSVPDLKVMTVLGTRPEIIRLARVLPLLDARTDHRLVHTGQNYDRSLSDDFFEELRLRPPDVHLGIDTTSLGATLGDILRKVEPVLEEHRPDAVLVLGDTNSSLAALMAKRLRITVYHMEAGNRCFDENVPEEINRRVIDHLADFNLAYTEHARRHLLAEGLHPRRVTVTGSPLREVLEHFRPDIDRSDVLARLGLEVGGFLVASVHREENVDRPDRLRLVLDSLDLLREELGVPVVVSTHPRTRKRLDALGDGLHRDLRFSEPFGFFDYNALQLAAACVVSDSGSVAEEAAILGFPAVTLRDAMERPEALETGSVLLTGLDPENVVRAVAVAVAQRSDGRSPEVPADYRITDTSQRVLDLIVGTARLHHRWAGLHPDAD